LIASAYCLSLLPEQSPKLRSLYTFGDQNVTYRPYHTAFLIFWNKFADMGKRANNEGRYSGFSDRIFFVLFTADDL